jgi:ribosome-associated protein
MDYVDFIVHVFSREKRVFYGLERLRKSATTISVAALSAELKSKIASSRDHKAASRSIKPASKTATKAVAAKKSSAKKAPAKSAAKKKPAVKPARSKRTK